MRTTYHSGRRLGLIVLVLLGVSACGSASPSEQPVTEWRGEPLTEEQLPIAADGTVTLAELRGAYESAARCIEATGGQASVEEQMSGGFSLGVTLPPGEELDEALYNSCLDQYVGNLSNIYLASRLVTGEERERDFGAWQECMESAGASVDDVRLGDSMENMMVRLEELNGLVPTWPIEMHNCIERYYFVLWPESLG